MMASAQNDPRRAGTIWVIDLHESRPQPEARLPAEFRQLGSDRAEMLAPGLSDTPAREIVRRFESGRRCYTAWVGGQLASYGWVSFHEEYVGELNLRIRLLPGEAYIWDCFTVPAYRKQGLYSALLAHVLTELEKDSVCRVWIGADADNIVSQRGIARAGFRHVADMVLARVFAIRQVWLQGMPGASEAVLAEARRAFLDNRDSVWLKAMERLKNTSQVDSSAPNGPGPETSLPEAPSAVQDSASHPTAVQ